MEPVNLFITDDHELVLEGLTSLIQGIPGFVLAGRARSGEELISKLHAADNLPDIAILDIEMPGMDGVETLNVLKDKFSSVKVLILTMHEESFYINRMIKAGADGFLLKNLNRDSFINCIRKIIDGQSFFVEGLTEVNGLKDIPQSSTEILTAREKHILRLIAQGKTNKQIAVELFISNRTVDTHRNNLKRKLNAASTVHLVHYAYSNGLV